MRPGATREAQDGQSPDTGARRGGRPSARRLWSRIRHDDVAGLAAEIAYRFLFAVFPFGLFVAALGAVVAGLLHIADPAGRLLAALGDNLPGPIADTLRPQLQQVMSTVRPDLLSGGAVVALWAATGGTLAVTKGIGRAYDVREGRPLLLRYAVALAVTILLAAGVIASFVTIVGGSLVTQQVASQVGLGPAAWALLQALRWPAVFVALTLAVTVLYRYTPNVVVPWRWILVGAACFTVGWLLATAALGFYVANVAHYGATYGSLGGVIVLMLWFYVTAALLVVGAEITAELVRTREPGSVRRRREEDAVASGIDGAADRVRREAESAAGTRAA